MRLLMAPTKPATADVALFLSDRFFIILLRPLVMQMTLQLTDFPHPSFDLIQSVGFCYKRKESVMWTLFFLSSFSEILLPPNQFPVDNFRFHLTSGYLCQRTSGAYEDGNYHYLV